MPNSSIASEGPRTIDERIADLESEIQKRYVVVRTKESDIAGLMRIVEATNAAFATANTELIDERQALETAREKLKDLYDEKPFGKIKKSATLIARGRENLMEKAERMMEYESVLTSEGQEVACNLFDDYETAQFYLEEIMDAHEDTRRKWFREVLDVKGYDVDELIEAKKIDYGYRTQYR